MPNQLQKDSSYKTWLKSLKAQVKQAQLKAAVQVNTILLEFYWNLGADILEKQKTAKWGDGFLKQLSSDLSAEFPEIKGFSYRNLVLIRQWRSFYSSEIENVKQPVSQLIEAHIKQLFQVPWGHHIAIIQKCDSVEKAFFYVAKTIENNWSRSVLIHQVESDLYSRQGKALTNFSQTLPTPQSDLAKAMIKDPYHIDFIPQAEKIRERDLENSLIDHISKFLLELGAGFAYMGRQVGIQVGQRDFFLDLLFYHTKLHCYVVIELKTVEFEPEFAGKLNFYLSAVDELIKQEQDAPTIGILLCKSKDKTVVEYALRDVQKPMGISEYKLTQSLPDELKSNLPSIEDLEAEFDEELEKMIDGNLDEESK